MAAQPRFIRQTDGTVTFKVKSDGTTGEGWIARLQAVGHIVRGDAKKVLRSSAFVPTKKGTIHNLTLLPYRFLGWGRLHKMANVREKAKGLQLSMPHPEVAPLICMMFSIEDIRGIGLADLIVVHDSIEVADGRRSLLCVGTDDDDSDLYAVDDPGEKWGVQYGFVFSSASDSTF